MTVQERSFNVLPKAVDSAFSLVTSGFTALDVLPGHDSRPVQAGGTAVNVAAAACSMGWHAEVAGRVGLDMAGDLVRRDLAASGVGVHLLDLDPTWSTPIVLQEHGPHGHIWRFHCPVCGGRFARHRPASAADAESLVAHSPTPTVFFFDRASLYSLTLAEKWRDQGALVIFEPSGIGRPQLTTRAANLAHIVKYSADRAVPLGPALVDYRGLEIRTEGELGLSYRLAGDIRWNRQYAHATDQVIDAAGAGDWTTAGLMTALIRREGQPADDWLSDIELIDNALEVAQEWGSIACGWVGARPAGSAHLRSTVTNSSFVKIHCEAVLGARITA